MYDATDHMLILKINMQVVQSGFFPPFESHKPYNIQYYISFICHLPAAWRCAAVNSCAREMVVVEWS